MKRTRPAALTLTLIALAVISGCGTVTHIEMQTTDRLTADFHAVKAVGVASNNPQLVDCADAVLTEQLPPLVALSNVKVEGVFSALALAEAKRDALKIRPIVAQKCSMVGWVLERFSVLGRFQ